MKFSISKTEGGRGEGSAANQRRESWGLQERRATSQRSQLAISVVREWGQFGEVVCRGVPLRWIAEGKQPMKDLPSLHFCCSPLQWHLQSVAYRHSHHLPIQQRKPQLFSEHPTGPDPIQLCAAPGEERVKSLTFCSPMAEDTCWEHASRKWNKAFKKATFPVTGHEDRTSTVSKKNKQQQIVIVIIIKETKSDSKCKSESSRKSLSH